ncbi:nodulation protein NfeD [Candidatus Gracilibacteria bacterium]|nr:nodulation protein NfeD [Candidatus Gracilibacteria bacterium]
MAQMHKNGYHESMKLTAVHIIIRLLAVIVIFGGWSVPAAAQGRGPLLLVEVDEVISRFTVDHLRQALTQAEASNAEALIIRLGGSGAVLDAVRPFAAELAVAKVPVVVYVAPTGTAAGAAGAYLLSAAHIAAMAPETSFGTPNPLVSTAGLNDEAVRARAREEVAAQLRGWNEERGRSSGWIDRAVAEGAIIDNVQALALEPPAIDLVARELSELTTLLHGRSVRLADASERVLETLGRTPTTVAPTIWQRLLLLLANPTVAFLLLVMAAIAIYAELLTPTIGALAGLGVVLLVGALTGFTALPINWLSLFGLMLALGLIGADLLTPSHGALTIGGLALLVISALTLFDSAQAPGVSVAPWAVGMVALTVVAFVAVGVTLIVRTRDKAPEIGQEALVGKLAEVRKRLEPEGMVFVEGALWRAVSESGDIEIGDYVRVTGVYQLRLTVRSLDEPPEA